MSSSFYIYAERRAGDAWTLVGEPAFCEPWGCMRPPEWRWLNGKDQLATVLNGRLTLFWGLDHTGIEPIAEPRGLPDDLSPVLCAWAELHIEEGLAHEPSWLLAREILDFDWHARTILHRGYVMMSQAHHFDPEQPAPFPYDAWPEGDYQVVGDPFGLDRKDHGSQEEWLISTWPRPGSVEVHWTESHFEVLEPGDFLADLGQLGPPDEVRLIFWLEA